MTVWSSAAGSGNAQGKAGINVSVSSTATTTTVTATYYIATKYQCSDSSNTLYYGWSTSAGTTLASNRTVKTTSSSPWSSSNIVNVGSKSTSFSRGTSSQTKYAAFGYTGVAYAGNSASVYTSFSVPALASYTVSYNANGGSNAPSSQTKWYGSTLTLSSTIPTRTGYTFVGWGTSATATTSSYSAGAAYTANAAITLYAIWKKTLTLSYNANGGSSAPSSQSVTIYNATTSNTFTLSTTVPTKSGYTFVGWNTSSTATTSLYSAGGSITVSENTTLYAIWKKTLTLSYNANGGSGAPAAQSATIYNSTTSNTFILSSTVPTRTGYAFLGWSTSSDSKLATYEAGGSITVTNNITIYAIWTPLSIWHEAIVWVKVGTKWCKGLTWIKENGVWKKGTINVKANTNEEIIS